VLLCLLINYLDYHNHKAYDDAIGLAIVICSTLLETSEAALMVESLHCISHMWSANWKKCYKQWGTSEQL